jgi:hypothetical protein
MPVKPVAEVTVLPMPHDSAAKGNWMTTARVEADARALVWPQMCCCCGSTTQLDSIGIYSYKMFGSTRALIHIPYCRRCTSHYRRAGASALESAVKIPVIGFTILLLLFLSGMLSDQIVGFLLQLLVVFGSVVWGVRTYFVARAEMKKGITPACSVAGTAAVIFLTAQPSAWRFRFYSRAYAEQFAAVNPGGDLTTLYLD